MKPRTRSTLLVAVLLSACSGGSGSLFGPSDGGARAEPPSAELGAGTMPREDEGDVPARDAGRRDASTKDGAGTDAAPKDSGGKDATSPKDAGSVPHESCSPTSACDDGSTLQFCTTTAGGSCIGARYERAGTSYTCAACGNCTLAADDANSDCHPSTGPSNPVETCQPAASTCKVGGNVEYCSTSSSAGCTSARYKHNGVSYPCASCGSCDGAWGQAYVACMDAEYGCDDLEACCGSFPAGAQQGCYDAVTSYRGTTGGDVSCKSTYESYRNANYCP